MFFFVIVFIWVWVWHLQLLILFNKKINIGKIVKVFLSKLYNPLICTTVKIILQFFNRKVQHIQRKKILSIKSDQKSYILNFVFLISLKWRNFFIVFFLHICFVKNIIWMNFCNIIDWLSSRQFCTEIHIWFCKS